MLIIKKDPDDIASHEITPKDTYANRRRFLLGGGAAGAALIGGAYLLNKGRFAQAAETKQKLTAKPTQYTLESLGGEKLNTYKEVTTYNNFYEFGTEKSDPGENAGTLKTRPWTVVIEGECKKPQTIDIEKILKLAPLEDRVYRFRCVEAWSMVIPWIGYPLSEILKLAEPTSKAKFVAFQTLQDVAQMPGQKVPVLAWPYREGLRMDEAMYPLSIISVGLYGEVLPNQNGAPVRLVVPWKYGFKSIKSIVKIRFVEEQPDTSWNMAQAPEYGFYSNVNPEVDHPRWTQATERRIGELRRRKTLPFNGYATQVNKMYAGMDLRKNF